MINKQKIVMWIIFGIVVLSIIGNSMEEEQNNFDTSSIESNISTEELVVESSLTTEPIETEEEYKASCQEYKYKDVLRNPEEYIGKRIKVTVKISSVHENSLLNDGKYYFAYSNDEYGWWNGDRYGVFDRREIQDPKLLEEDIITVYGDISDPEYTSSLIITSSEVFCIDMKYIDFISE